MGAVVVVLTLSKSHLLHSQVLRDTVHKSSLRCDWTSKGTTAAFE